MSDINFIEPSVVEWAREGRDWIGFLARVASVSRRRPWGDMFAQKRRVEHCYKKKHVGVFEHWPVVLTYPPRIDENQPPWRQLGSRYYGSLRQCISDWTSTELPVPYIHSFVDMSTGGAPREAMRTFHFTCSRAAMAQLRTYRTCITYLVESQRYCDYARMGFDFVRIRNTVTDARARLVREQYIQSREAGMAPEDARMWLPQCFATRMVVSAPEWKWRYIIEQRAHHSTGQAQGEISSLMQQVEILL